MAIAWYPQPRQEELLVACGLLDAIRGTGGAKPAVADLIGYGGAAYGGKTDANLGMAIVAAFAWSGVKIAFFRRTFPELSGVGGAINRSHELLSNIAQYKGDDHAWVFPNGSVLQFFHCQYEVDVYKYKSLQFDILIIDEATSFTWWIVDYLLTRNRATIPGIKPFAVMTTNPGDVGHSWYMQVFDTINSLGGHRQTKITENPNGKRQSVYFIPAFLEDNGIGLKRDPDYESRLLARDPAIARALRYGDWTVFSGQAFPDWRYDRHVQPYRELPNYYPRWRSLDYGFTHPMVCYWWAIDPDTGRQYVYRELHQAKLTDRQQARLVREMTLANEIINMTYASPDMWSHKNTNDIVTTTADEYKAEGIILTKADNDRLNGKRKIHRALANLPDGEPGVVIFDTCPELIKLMPMLTRSKDNPEDVEKVDGDDPYDAFRYGFTRMLGVNQSTRGQNQPINQVRQSPLVGMRGL